ncbi:hypothetical protein [Methanobrevibacter millerae]|uniref:Uncharacterized protein n=1 Tax=Methanobrevibacter millerae TaxID=230361 RepID=A0A1G5XN35_9EURY|nr:hypothetical protein [Methanobrevibacter millerae]SDA71868.1 hypothetical protein SAMN02910315_02382 [Methanobrevibacter millerae]
MSPEKVTIIDRDGWEPIGSGNFSIKERIEAKKNMEDAFFNVLGIKLNLKKVTYVDLY